MGDVGQEAPNQCCMILSLCVVQYMYIGALTDVEEYSTQLY